MLRPNIASVLGGLNEEKSWAFEDQPRGQRDWLMWKALCVVPEFLSYFVCEPNTCRLHVAVVEGRLRCNTSNVTVK
jgi:hypothetical protein